MIRTTVRLPEQVLREAKKLAADSGRTLTAVIEDSLREAIARRRAAKPRSMKVKLKTFCGKGVAPGVDLDDSAANRDFMEASDAAP